MLTQLPEAGRLVKSVCLLFISLVLMFVQSNDLYAATKEEALRIGEKEPEVSCPSQDFYEFFNAFSRNEDVQRAFTKVPLKILNVDKRAIPSYVRFLDTLSVEEIISVFPFSQEKAEHLFAWNIIGITNDHAEVEVKHPFALSYLFNKYNKDACWKLEFIDCLDTDCNKVLKLAMHADRPKQEASKSEKTRSCPFPDFPSFLYAFTENKTVQLTFTKAPLTFRYVDRDGFPDLIRVVDVLDRQKIISILSPLTRAQKRFEYDLRLIGYSDHHAEVKISGVSGFGIEYHFQKDACWKLVFVDDYSL